ncbi:hypothetical protein EVAR_401_1 [Eumeta japonica]|uniref:Uncharacterized protein n=1 Tax=Eumeta variegata TaxID=151549 RepID=A0A4C1SD75_EUMVA|nr:hypothetical protein EVAR_401_1 [Eumeta japonica]
MRGVGRRSDEPLSPRLCDEFRQVFCFVRYFVLDPDFNHIFDSDPIPTLVHGSNFFLNFGPAPVSDSAVYSAFNSDSAASHSFDLNKTEGNGTGIEIENETGIRTDKEIEVEIENRVSMRYPKQSYKRVARGGGPRRSCLLYRGAPSAGPARAPRPAPPARPLVFASCIKLS